MKKTILFIILCIFLFTFLSSCERAQTKYSFHSFDCFDTVTAITGYADTKEEFDLVANEAISLLREYHALYTIYERYEGKENLCTINELTDGTHTEKKVDTRIIDMLDFAREMHTLTGGELNVAMGSVLSIWHDYRSFGMDDPTSATLPPLDTLREASGHTDIEKMIIDKKNSTVFLADPQTKLDVGAIAKGYAVEMVARALEAKGVDGYIINVGGNIRGVGTQREWTVGIENPRDEENPYIAYLSIKNQAVVTSGCYQRFYIVDGESYHHIIDRDTLMPSELYLSVSVVCPSSALGDALSTALFCMPLDEGQALVASLDGVEALWVTPDGTLHYSDGFHHYERLQ